MSAPRLLITRPEADARRFAEQLEHAGYRHFIEPLLNIAALPWTPPTERMHGIILTSRHALEALTAHPALYALPRFMVGDYAPDVDSLITKLITHTPPTPLLYLRGRTITRDITSALAAHGTHVEERIVYTADAASALSLPLCHALQSNHLTAATFFSARTADIFSHLIHVANLQLTLRTLDAFTLSAPIARHLGALPWRSIITSDAPTLSSLRESIDKRYAGQ